jgi:hypothetical protein
MQNGGKETTTTVACSQSVVEAGLPDFSWCNVPKWGKIPNDPNIYQVGLQ